MVFLSQKPKPCHVFLIQQPLINGAFCAPSAPGALVSNFAYSNMVAIRLCAADEDVVHGDVDW